MTLHATTTHKRITQFTMQQCETNSVSKRPVWIGSPDFSKCAPDRLAIIEKIKDYEKKGLFTHDVEDDPPTRPLKPDECDYTKKKLSSKICTAFVNFFALRFIYSLIKKNQLIIKDVKGLENMEAVRNTGAIITCNHFNAFDNFALHKVLRPYLRKGIIWKVIREGNYTSFPGLYGWFFRNCNTLPLASSFSVMKEFLSATDTLLRKGEKILVYAEQGMWWNYRKPRPLASGAFKFAVKSNVPVVPIFITMQDSNLVGADGFYIQEYTVNILKPIYPDSSLSDKENIELLRNKNYEAWKQVYEEFYGVPLSYED